MSGSDTYEADFEAEDGVRSTDAVAEEEHHLRLSVEFHSVRDLQATASLYFVYSYPLIGPKPIRSQSVVVTRNTECRVDNAFQSVEFFLTRSRLYSTLASTPLLFEVYQTDKYEKELQRAAKIKTQVVRPDPLVAPFAKLQPVGSLKITLADQPVAEVPLVALVVISTERPS